MRDAAVRDCVGSSSSNSGAATVPFLLHHCGSSTFAVVTSSGGVPSHGSGKPKLRNSLPSAYCAPAYLPV